MHREGHRRIAQDGRFMGTVRGVVVSYHDRAPARPEGTYLNLRIEEIDLPDFDGDGFAGRVVAVRIGVPADANFLLKDLRDGFADGGLEPVPEGSVVTFGGAEIVNVDEIEVSGYDIDSIRRPASPAP